MTTVTLYRPTGPKELALVAQSGWRRHAEWWIPAGELEALNDHIVGTIAVTRSFGAETGG